MIYNTYIKLRYIKIYLNLSSKIINNKLNTKMKKDLKKFFTKNKYLKRFKNYKIYNNKLLDYKMNLCKLRC